MKSYLLQLSNTHIKEKKESYAANAFIQYIENLQNLTLYMNRQNQIKYLSKFEEHQNPNPIFKILTQTAPLSIWGSALYLWFLSSLCTPTDTPSLVQRAPSRILLFQPPCRCHFSAMRFCTNAKTPPTLPFPLPLPRHSLFTLLPLRPIILSRPLPFCCCSNCKPKTIYQYQYLIACYPGFSTKAAQMSPSPTIP